MDLEYVPFIQEVSFDREKVERFDIYPFNIPIIQKLDSLKRSSPVTFLVGENGVGKSTFIEALAIACGFNPEGGTQNFMFYTKETHSKLYQFMKIKRSYRKCVTKFFSEQRVFIMLHRKLNILMLVVMGMGVYIPVHMENLFYS